MFQNLIDNAIKYARARDGGAGRGAAGRRGPAGASPSATRATAFPPTHLPRLTERFYRVDNARSRQLGGTGLGLAIVKHVVNRHRGRLDIQSTPGKGSIFTVTLPIAER